jgi:hypothetical protein
LGRWGWPWEVIIAIKTLGANPKANTQNRVIKVKSLYKLALIYVSLLSQPEIRLQINSNIFFIFSLANFFGLIVEFCKGLWSGPLGLFRRGVWGSRFYRVTPKY